MKDKLKAKSLDVLLTFFSSVIAIYLYFKSSSFVESLMDPTDLSKENIKMLLALYFSTIIAIVYTFLLCILVIFEKICAFFARPKVTVTFFNKNGKKEYELDFKEHPGQPLYVKVSFMAKFSRFQLFVLNTILNAKIMISLNPKLWAIELHNGFVGDDADYKVVEGSLRCNLFAKYLPSKEEKGFYTELSLLLISPADGEVKVNLDLSEVGVGKFKSMVGNVNQFLFNNYCKFEVDPIILKG